MRVREGEGEVMTTKEEVYDWLLSERIREPAVLVLGERHIVGRWEEAANIEPTGYICRAGRIAIVVLGWGDNWSNALEAAKAHLARPLP